LVVRNVLECVSCQTKVITRTQVGHRDKQEHSFPCPKCGVKITYILDLDQARAKWSFRTPTNAEWVKSEDGAITTLAFSDEIPVPSEMGGMFSPFLAAFWKIADLDAFRHDEGLRQLFIKTHFPLAERCVTHFERGNWDLFDKESPHPHGKAVSVRDRLVGLYNFFTAAFMKFTLNPNAKHGRVQQRLRLAEATSSNLYDELAQYALTSGRIKKLWQEIINVRGAMVAVYPFIQPLIQMRYWKKEHQDFTKFNLSDKRFDQLKQLYIDCFETLCRLMTLVIGIELIIHINQLEIPTKKGSMSLDEFESMPNANKVPIISRYPVADLFVAVLDTDFRNSIGHHSAHYEADTDEVVVFHSKKVGTGATRMRYTEFCNKVLDLFAAFELAVMYHHDIHLHLEGKFS
jgi:hypothetical protein